MNYEHLQSLLILPKNYKVETFPLIHQKCKKSSPVLALANNVAKCAQWSEQINFNMSKFRLTQCTPVQSSGKIKPHKLCNYSPEPDVLRSTVLG